MAYDRLFGRVPGGPQVGTANRSQGQAHYGPGQDQGRPFGDQGLPIRLSQAQARGGLGQARGGQVPRSAGQATGLLDMLGHTIPSVFSCFNSFRLCDPHKRIFWDSKAPSD